MIPWQIIYRPLQYPQQSMQMIQPRLPQGVPYMQRGIIYRNANTVANSNIQYISGNYAAASSPMPSSPQMYEMTQDAGLIVNASTGGNTISFTFTFTFNIFLSSIFRTCQVQKPTILRSNRRDN